MDPLCASSEITLAVKEAELILDNIDEWMKPGNPEKYEINSLEKRSVPLVQFPGIPFDYVS